MPPTSPRAQARPCSEASIGSFHDESVGGAWLLAPLALTVLLYSPVFWSTYGVSEDYRLLAFYQRGGVSPAQMLAEGRPLYAMWSDAVFGSAKDIAALRAIRTMNVVFIGTLATLCAAAWRMAGFRRAEASAISLMIVSLPPFQLYASCAFMGGVPVAAIAAATAALLAYRAAHADSFRRSSAYRIAAFLLLLVSLLTYQPAAMFYWVIVAILLVAGDAPGGRSHAVRDLIGVGLAALPVGLLVHRFAVSAYADSAGSASRTGLTSDVAQKAVWFMSSALRDSLNVWSVVPSSVLALAVATAVACGLLLRLREPRALLWPRILLALMLVPLAYLPNLVVAENWSSYRSQIALASLLVCYAATVIRAPFLASRLRLRRAFVLTTCLIALWLGTSNVTNLVIEPQMRELTIVRSAVAGWPASVARIAVVPSRATDALAPVVRYDEFGRPSTSHQWSAVDLPYVLLNDSRSERGLLLPDLHLADGLDATAQLRVDWGEVLRGARLRNPLEE